MKINQYIEHLFQELGFDYEIELMSRAQRKKYIKMNKGEGISY